MTNQTTLEFIKTLDAAIAGGYEVSNHLEEARERLDELISMVDGAYDIVEICPATAGTYNSEWKKNWLEKARKHGASSI